MAKHHLDPTTQRCTQCGAHASAIFEDNSPCEAMGKRRHFILVDNDGTREIFAPRGTGARG